MSITVRDLNFSYCTHDVLHNVSFTAEAGQLTAVLGANGVGKTTLFRCILGLHTRYHGEILVEGVNTRKLSARELAHRVAYIPQIHQQAFPFRVMDMVLMGTSHGFSPWRSPGAKEEQDAIAALEQVGISHLARKNYSHLSGGEQQLVLIARALAQQTRILLMDEPTAALDYGNQDKILDTVRGLASQGYTVLLSTHNPQHALWYADQVLALADGRVAAFGPSQQVLSPELIHTLYGIDVTVVSTQVGPLLAPSRVCHEG